MQIRGHLVNIFEQKIDPVEILIQEGIITKITPIDAAAASIIPPVDNAGADTAASPHGGSPSPDNAGSPNASAAPGLSAPDLSGTTGPYILPGFVDAHVHIESSLLIPSEFARMAVVHGTIATVSDPHEIANVCGLEGIEFMIRNGNSVPFYFNFGAPSCVPATQFETAGATLDAKAVTSLLERKDIKYLSEMMNFPGVLHKDPEVMAKIAAAARLGKPVDGHAPGLRGEEARQYIDAGISTDHECFTAEEALDKLRAGMHILIREGSAARNFEALIPLLNDYPGKIMFCSDDKHPDSLLVGHINALCARAVAKGIDLFKVLRAACLNPVEHYKLEHGLVRTGDPADFIIVEDLVNFRVLQTYVRGQCVAANGVTRIASSHLVASSATPTTTTSLLTASPVNNFKAEPRQAEDFAYPLDKWGEQENVEQVYCIEALDGQLITNKLIVPVADANPQNGRLHSNSEKDLLKIVVVNRYNPAPVAKSFIRNFGLKRGAIASSVAHDSHNIVAVGVDDESICRAVNLVIAQKGGLSCVDPAAEASTLLLPLPVGGLMSLDDAYHVAESYTAIDNMAKDLGSSLAAPFMTLSFMALLVIPHLKLGDMGLFDGDKFALI
ncbi:MAG TPA: adenine deaminase [Puia sp.]|nr:adenine deaminase [Puia sp.]